jgi:hypothetical protein
MNNLKLFLGACLVSIVLIPIGIVWNLGKSIYNFFKYWYFIGFQIVITFKYLLTKKGQPFLYKGAFAQDLLWNVTAGEFLEDCFTDNENTMFGKAKITVSASTGKEILNGAIVKRGEWFPKWLNRRFKEDRHCENAWIEWIEEHGESL